MLTVLSPTNLQFAYVVFNIYCNTSPLTRRLTLLVCTTNFVPGAAETSTSSELTQTAPSLPPMIINAYTTILDLLRQILPATIRDTLHFAYTATTHTLTP